MKLLLSLPIHQFNDLKKNTPQYIKIQIFTPNLFSYAILWLIIFILPSTLSATSSIWKVEYKLALWSVTWGAPNKLPLLVFTPWRGPFPLGVDLV